MIEVYVISYGSETVMRLTTKYDWNRPRPLSLQGGSAPLLTKDLFCPEEASGDKILVSVSFTNIAISNNVSNTAYIAIVFDKRIYEIVNTGNISW